MTLLLGFLIGGIATYGFRISMIVVGGGTVASNLAQRLRYVTPAAAAAIVVSALLVENGSPRLAPGSELLAVLAGFVAVRRSGQAWLALVVGLPTYWAAAAAGL